MSELLGSMICSPGNLAGRVRCSCGSTLTRNGQEELAAEINTQLSAMATPPGEVDGS